MAYSNENFNLGNTGEPRRASKVTPGEVLSRLDYGLLYKRDKFCRRCEAIDWSSAIWQVEEREDNWSSSPLFGEPRKLRDVRRCCELGDRFYLSLLQHPELQHDCEGPRKCGHEFHTVLEDETLEINLVKLDGDFNIEISAPSAAYELAIARRKGRVFKALAKLGSRVKRTVHNTEVAQHWLKDCQENHEECRALHSTNLESPLPTRVIDVLRSTPDGKPSPRLIDSQGARGQYATLSYVWGGGSRFVASRGTLEQLRKSIDLDALPKLFQDAITLTRQIGLPYLWIDALCIMQDSTEDLINELSFMTDIYRNSSLTLAAAAQRSVHNDLIRDGVFSYVHASQYDSAKSYLECTTRGGRFTTYLAFGHPMTLEYPLHTRAWCLQETLLSQRTLVLGMREMYWFCGAYERRASSFESRRKRQPGDYEVEIYGPVTAANVTAPDLKERPFNFWYHTIAKYSQRRLTFADDRLPALSGLARLMEAEYLSPGSAGPGEVEQKSEYLAGLWAQDLWHGLLWRSQRRGRFGMDNTRLDESIPSWSWAAWDMPVSWRRHVKPDESASAAPQRNTPLSSILSCSVTLASPSAPYGEVRGGELKLMGRTAPLRFKEDMLTEKGYGWNVASTICKFCTCDSPAPEMGSYLQCEIHLNDPDLVDQTCIVLQMTQREALILHPCSTVSNRTGAESSAETKVIILEPRPDMLLKYMRVGILVAMSSIELGWSEESVEVTII